MTNDYPFHRDYVRALKFGNVPALKKLIQGALRAKPQERCFVEDDLTPFEELVTAVWRTFECCHTEHGLLFLKAGLPPNLLLPDVEGLSKIYFTPLEVAVFGSAEFELPDRARLVEALLAAGADPQRRMWPHMGRLGTIADHVMAIDVAQVFRRWGVPDKAFVELHARLRFGRTVRYPESAHFARATVDT
jgi:hypothetical protein